MLQSFNVPNGLDPYGPVLLASNGLFYGTTIAGSTSNYGTVYQVNTDGSHFSTVKFFQGTDGQSPEGGVVEGPDGALYGTTFQGGISNFGTIFKMNKDGSGFNSFHSFTGGADGKNCQAGLLLGSDGALYGTTVFASSSTRGTIFKVTNNGSNYTIIHNFTGNPDGQQPAARLMESTNGFLYGTTPFGGSHVAGTIFTLDKNGNNYLVIYNFGTIASDGTSCVNGLIEGSDGVLYGMTQSGGGTSNSGTIFSINNDGNNYQIIHRFSTAGTDGQHPVGNLVEGANGFLYGMTGIGGTAGRGIVFRIDKTGTNYAILRTFTTGAGDGQSPEAGLISLTNGWLCGTTQMGGDFGVGSIFFLSSTPPLPRILSLTTSSQTNSLLAAGTYALPYDFQRSQDLSTWTNLLTLTAPYDGRFTCVDSNPPPGAAFYRLHQH